VEVERTIKSGHRPRWPRSLVVRDMSTTNTRRVSVSTVIGALVVAAAIVIALIAGGGVSYGSGASNRTDIERDKALQAADHYGSTACDRLDMFLASGHGWFHDAKQWSEGAKTEAIRNARGPETMRKACVDAGAAMSEPGERRDDD
jgi:hypothetical protein